MKMRRYEVVTVLPRRRRRVDDGGPHVPTPHPLLDCPHIRVHPPPLETKSFRGRSSQTRCSNNYLRKLVQVHQGTSEEAAGGVREHSISWKDVFWGKKTDDRSKADEWEQKDLEQLREEFTKRT